MSRKLSCAMEGLRGCLDKETDIPKERKRDKLSCSSGLRSFHRRIISEEMSSAGELPRLPMCLSLAAEKTFFLVIISA